MNEQLPQTPLEAVREMRDLTLALAQRTAAYRAAEHDAATKRAAAELAQARAFLNADGAMDLRKQVARIEAAPLLGAADVAEALVRVLKQEIRNIETSIDCSRTTAATIRAELSTLGMQP